MAIRSVDGRVMRVASDEPDGKSPKALWQYGAFAHVNAMAMGGNAVLIAGELTTDEREKHALVALALDDGRPLWREPLPAMPVQSGIAIDAAGRIVVAIEDGETIVYGAKQH
jgi:outer membrane protein assembly factor BamB